MSVLGAATTAINTNPTLELGAFVSIVSIFTGVILKITRDDSKRYDKFFEIISENTEKVTHHRDGIDDLTQAVHENTRVTREMKVAFEISEKYNQLKKSKPESGEVGQAGPME